MSEQLLQAVTDAIHNLRMNTRDADYTRIAYQVSTSDYRALRAYARHINNNIRLRPNGFTGVYARSTLTGRITVLGVRVIALWGLPNLIPTSAEIRDYPASG